MIKGLTLNGELSKGSRNMKQTATTSFDFISFSSKYGLTDSQHRISLAGLSLGIVTKQALFDYGRRLVSLAEDTYFLRQVEILEKISEKLTALSLPEFENIGAYYKALCLKREGHTEKACALFERVSEEGPAFYRARAIQSLGATYFDNSDYDSARRLFIEAQHLACRNKYSNPLAFLQSQWWLGILQSIEGNYESSVANFEALRPMVEVIASRHPSMWFNYQNNLAVELMNVGRIEEAQQACRIALASPFASLYPEWRETARDLARKSRRASPSFVSLSIARENRPKAVSHSNEEAASPESGENIFRLKAPARSITPDDHEQSPARILAFRNKSEIADCEVVLNDVDYLEKRYRILVTAAETMDHQLLDEMYEPLRRRDLSGHKMDF